MSGGKHHCDICGELLPNYYLHAEKIKTLSGRIGWGWSLSRGVFGARKTGRMAYKSRRNVYRYVDRYTCLVCFSEQNPRRAKRLGYRDRAIELFMQQAEKNKPAMEAPMEVQYIAAPDAASQEIQTLKSYFGNSSRESEIPLERNIMGTLRNKSILPIYRGDFEEKIVNNAYTTESKRNETSSSDVNYFSFILVSAVFIAVFGLIPASIIGIILLLSGAKYIVIPSTMVFFVIFIPIFIILLKELRN